MNAASDPATARASQQATAAEDHARPLLSAGGRHAGVPAGRISAGGTMWRLRSLVAMGHDSARIARALSVSPDLVRRLVAGQTRTITAPLAALARQLWDAWWDKTPPQDTPAARRAAALARRQAKTRDWPAAAALDEDQLDDPGYRPWSHYRPATGTGPAPRFTPAQDRASKPRQIA